MSYTFTPTYKSSDVSISKETYSNKDETFIALKSGAIDVYGNKIGISESASDNTYTLTLWDDDLVLSMYINEDDATMIRENIQE